MKIALGYPPLSGKGIPLLPQNRQFQWSHKPWTAYPVVAGFAATLLKKSGFSVVWLDGISAGWRFEKWGKELEKESPDLLAMETKTPVVKKHWKIINLLKSKNQKLKIALFGDHVTALPEESFKNSKVDFILTGGDYDFLLLSLARHLAKGEKLEPGIWYREKGKAKNTGRFKLNHNLEKLPLIDRELTCWRFYAYRNSNYLKTPGTYTMFGRDCWWGKCSFCSWTTLYPGSCYRNISPKKALDEVGHLIKNYQVKEIMDDSGTFPVGNWLREFCRGMVKRGYQKKVRMSINMRFNAGLTEKDYLLMGKAGFRFLLYGLESANQKTLNRLNKNLPVEMVKPVLTWAKKAGLSPHVTVMVGYPWEGREEAKKTLALAKDLFRRGLADSIQATVMIPYPGTPLFREAKKRHWLKTTDWDRYDMREPILKTKMSGKELQKLVRTFYWSIFSPQFVLRKLKEGFTSGEKFKQYFRFGLKFPLKLLDFARR